MNKPAAKRIFTVNDHSLFRAFIILFSAILFSCNEQKGNATKANAVTSQEPDHPVKPPSSYTDTLQIDKEAAVFFSPDSLQLEKIKATTQKMNFESMTHESYYQMRNARIVLKKYRPGLTIMETSKCRFLNFHNRDGSRTCIDLDKKGDIWGIYFFTPGKEPELIDMMNIDTALGFYFKD